MKKLFSIIIILLFFVPAYAGMKILPMVGQTVAGGDSELLVSWDGGDTTGSRTQLNTYQENSGTVTSTNVDFSVTGYGGTGYAAYVDSDAVCSFVCTDGTSIDLDQGEITFDYNRQAVPQSYGTFFMLGSGSADFRLMFYSTPGETIQFRYGGNRYSFPVSTGYPFNIGTYYSFKFTWNAAGSVDPRLWIDDVEVTGGSWTTGSDYGAKPSPAAVMHIGDDASPGYRAMGAFDNFKIYSDIQ